MEPRILAATATLNTADAQALGIIQDDVIEIAAGESTVRVRACLSDEIAAGVVALPRHMMNVAVPLTMTSGTVSRVSEALAAAD